MLIMSSNETILIDGYKHIKYNKELCTEGEMLKKSEAYFNKMSNRRSIRHFSTEPFSIEIIENIIKTAGMAPSGANKRPWTFCVVKSSEIKKKIREAAEIEERKSYEERMSQEWLQDLKHLGTNANKPFLEEAPYLIVVFKQIFEYDLTGGKHQNYYVNESVGLACGFLISAIHNAGLVTVTHTPSPMRFLEKILERPDNERAYLLLPVGFPAKNAFVPAIEKKKVQEILKVY